MSELVQQLNERLTQVTAERDALLAEVARLRRVIERVAECVCFFDHKTVKGVKTDVLVILDEQPDSKRCDVQPYGPDTRCNLTRGHEGTHETSAPMFTAMGLDEPEFPTIKRGEE